MDQFPFRGRGFQSESLLLNVKYPLIASIKRRHKLCIIVIFGVKLFQDEFVLLSSSRKKYTMFLQWIAQMDVRERYHLGYSLEDMLFDCAFVYCDCSNGFVYKKGRQGKLTTLNLRILILVFSPVSCVVDICGRITWFITLSTNFCEYPHNSHCGQMNSFLIVIIRNYILILCVC